MDKLFKRVFDAEKETDLYSDKKKSIIQIVLVAVITLAAVLILLLVMTIINKNDPDMLAKEYLIKWDGKVYEEVKDKNMFLSLNINENPTTDDIGEEIGTLDDKSRFKDAPIYHLKNSTSDALILLKNKDKFSLYAFCYFISNGSSGKDILDICTSGTELDRVEFITGSDSEEAFAMLKSIDNKDEIRIFIDYFKVLNPVSKSDKLSKHMKDVETDRNIITLCNKDGSYFNMYYYPELKGISGFRNSFKISNEFDDFINSI